MATVIEDFPHHNATYANDERVAMWTILSMSLFVIGLCVLALYTL